MSRSPDVGQIIVAFFIVAFGLVFAYEGSAYQLGSAERMGPGYFPVAAGLTLALLGVGLVIEALSSYEKSQRVRFRAPLMVTAAMGIFAVLLPRHGFVPAVFALVIVSAFAESRRSITEVVALALMLCAIGAVVFVMGFNIPVKYWGM